MPVGGKRPKQMYVVLIGPQGSGKGTQADRLAGARGLVKISTGDLFRAARTAGTALGKQVDQYLDKGELVPDDVTLSIVDEQLDAIETGGARGAVFDGFPRTDGQAVGLEASLRTRGAVIDAVIELEVPETELVERLGGRRVCSQCGRTFHLTFDPPPGDGVCETCGGTVVRRADDTDEAIRRRLSLYRDQTAPLISYYASRGLVRRLNGSQSMEGVERDIKVALDGLESQQSSE